MNIFIDTEDMEERYGEELYKEYLEKENKELHNKIDKAIKFIEDEAYVDYEMEMSHNLYEGEIFELLKILKGDVDDN